VPRPLPPDATDGGRAAAALVAVAVAEDVDGCSEASRDVVEVIGA
jgi:hypothetical protein